MDNAPLSLELVPIDVPASDQAPARPPAAPQSSPTTSSAHDVVAAAQASLDAHAIEIRPLERTFAKPAPVPAPGVGPGVASPASADAFIAQALREYAQGHLDAPLWDRALKQSNGDAEAAAATYIRARAIALRMLDRKRRETAKRAAAQLPDDHDSAMLPERGLWQRYKLAIVAAALIVPAGIAGAMFAASRGDEAVEPVPVAARAHKAPAAAPAPAPTAAVADHAGAKPSSSDALAQKVQELRDAGNYNVMVLFATEWTRKDPASATAWDALRVGYVHLRQYEDARNAAKKAVQLAPDDARLWRNLGAVNMDIDDPEAALAAYEQAAARNGADVDSLNAVAMLQARLGRPAEAKAAFERAAAAGPGDAVTACLRSGVAQMTAARDAYTLSRQVRAIDDRCHGRGEPVAAAR
jgi:tetratricopeptide (TPR) repeat protein